MTQDKSQEKPQIGKGRPTPTRKEAQAAKAQPLVPDRHDREAIKAQRVQAREAREKARVGALMGEEKYLPARDKGPQRKFARDYVDSRFNIGEWTIPIMVLVLLMTLINNPTFQLISLAIIWIFVGVAVIDSIFVGIRIKKLLEQKFGADKVQSGTKWYVGMRAMQLRPLRVPKPQVKRGQKPSL